MSCHDLAKNSSLVLNNWKINAHVYYMACRAHVVWPIFPPPSSLNSTLQKCCSICMLQITMHNQNAISAFVALFSEIFNRLSTRTTLVFFQVLDSCCMVYCIWFLQINQKSSAVFPPYLACDTHYYVFTILICMIFFHLAYIFFEDGD